MSFYMGRRYVLHPTQLFNSNFRAYQVPRAELFGEESQLLGGIILQLKQRWPCQQHLGEHGEPGLCYITPAGEHVGLNMRKLKIWASAIVRTLKQL